MHLAVDVVDGRREKEQPADDPPEVTDACAGRRADRCSVVAIAASSSDRGIAPVDRELAVAEALRRGVAPGAHRQHLVEQPRRGGLERFPVVEHAADVEVDVVAPSRPAVRALPVIFITGAIGLPVGVPRPVVNTTTCAPPPTMPVTDSTSRPGVSITVSPFCVIGAE